METHQIINLFKTGVVKVRYANHQNVIQETDGTLNIELIPTHLRNFDIVTRSTIKFFCLRTKSLKSFYPSKFFHLISLDGHPIEKTKKELNEDLISILLKSIVTFEYKTDNDHIRLAIGTLIPEYINKLGYSSERFIDENSPIQRYYDIQHNSIRTYRKQNLIRVF